MPKLTFSTLSHSSNPTDMYKTEKNILVQNLPKHHKSSSVQMSFGTGELNCIHGPVGNILFQDHFIPLDMETTNLGKYNSRIAIPWPSFELPSLLYGKKSIV